MWQVGRLQGVQSCDQKRHFKGMSSDWSTFWPNVQKYLKITISSRLWFNAWFGAFPQELLYLSQLVNVTGDCKSSTNQTKVSGFSNKLSHLFLQNISHKFAPTLSWCKDLNSQELNSHVDAKNNRWQPVYVLRSISLISQKILRGLWQNLHCWVFTFYNCGKNQGNYHFLLEHVISQQNVYLLQHKLSFNM